MKNSIAFLAQAYSAIVQAEEERELDNEDMQVLVTIKHLLDGIERKVNNRESTQKGWY